VVVDAGKLPALMIFVGIRTFKCGCTVVGVRNGYITKVKVKGKVKREDRNEGISNKGRDQGEEWQIDICSDKIHRRRSGHTATLPTYMPRVEGQGWEKREAITSWSRRPPKYTTCNCGQGSAETRANPKYISAIGSL